MTSSIFKALGLATGWQWVLRVMTTGAVSVCVILIYAWLGGVIAIIFGAISLSGILVSTLKPDSSAPGLTIAVIIYWWLSSQGQQPLWHSMILAMLLAVFHFGCSLAALAPPWAGVSKDALRRAGRAASLYLVACALAIGVVLAVVALPGTSSPILVWVGAIAVLVAVGAVRLFVQGIRN